MFTPLLYTIYEATKEGAQVAHRMGSTAPFDAVAKSKITARNPNETTANLFP
jgi:hypothetical protein